VYLRRSSAPRLVPILAPHPLCQIGVRLGRHFQQPPQDHIALLRDLGVVTFVTAHNR
jgi:hypothetical protein